MPVVEQMFGMLKSLYMRIETRIIPATKRDGKGTVVESIVHRRVEITVERETVSILVPGQPVGEADRTARGPSGPGLNCKDKESRSYRLPNGKAPGS